MNLEPTLRAAGAPPTIARAVGVWSRPRRVVAKHAHSGRFCVGAHPDDVAGLIKASMTEPQRRTADKDPTNNNTVEGGGLYWDFEVHGDICGWPSYKGPTFMNLSYRPFVWGVDGVWRLPGATADNPVRGKHRFNIYARGTVRYTTASLKPGVQELVDGPKLTLDRVTHLGDDFIFVPSSDWHNVVVVRDVVPVPDPE